MSEQFSNTEQALIERLRRAPQPELSAEAHKVIRARMLDALNHPPLPAPRPMLLRPAFVMVILAVGAVLIASGILFALSRQNQNILPTPTIEASLTLIPTETLNPTSTSLPTITADPSVTAVLATSVPLVISSPVATSTPTVEVTQSSTPVPTKTVSTVIVIQGPVESIDGNVLIIYGVRVEIDPNNPILKTIVVGDVLRVEGTQTGTPVIIVSPTIIAVNVPPTTNAATQSDTNPPLSGQVWQDDGTCNNPPPDWAPANGWRRRCQGQTSNSTGGGNNNGNGNSNGNGGSNGNNGNGNGNSGGNGNGNGKPNKP